MPTRTGLIALHDLLVHARRDDLEDADRLRDVLEGALAEALEDEVRADAVRRLRSDDDLAALRRAREARRLIGRRAGRRERPALRGSGADLRRADERVARVDSPVERDGREDTAVLLVEALRLLPDGERGARRVQRVVGGGAIGLEDHHEAVAGGLVDVAVVALDDLEERREVGLDELVQPL